MIAGLVYHDIYKLLFLFSEDNPPIKEQLYLFMKRFRTQPDAFFKMDRALRLDIFKREYKIVCEEYEEYEAAKNKSTK